jgi:NADH-quinone oxidoreductase subunit J
MAPPPAKEASYSHVKAIGTLLYSNYLYPFEIAGVILLVAMIAAIALTFRGPRGTKVQRPAKQAQVRKEDRLTVINMAAEKEGKSG